MEYIIQQPTLSNNQVYNSMTVYLNSSDHLELIRTPTLSSVLLSIACTNVTQVLFESIRMSEYYLLSQLHMIFLNRYTTQNLLWFFF